MLTTLHIEEDYDVSDFTPEDGTQKFICRRDTINHLAFYGTSRLEAILPFIPKHTPNVKQISICKVDVDLAEEAVTTLYELLPPTISSIQLFPTSDMYAFTDDRIGYGRHDMEELRFIYCGSNSILDAILGEFILRVRDITYLSVYIPRMSDKTLSYLREIIQSNDATICRLSVNPGLRGRTFETYAHEWMALRDTIEEMSSLTKLKFAGDLRQYMIPTRIPKSLQSISIWKSEGEEDTAILDKCVKIVTRIPETTLNSFSMEMNATSPDVLERMWFIVDAFRDVPIERIREFERIDLNSNFMYGSIKFFTEVLSKPNKLEMIGFGDPAMDEVNLAEMFDKPCCNIDSFRIPHGNLPRSLAIDVMRLVRGRSRIREFLATTSEPLYIAYALFKPWFQVIQAILSARYIPRLAGGVLSAAVPWEDHILGIAEALGWKVDFLYVGDREEDGA